MSRKTKIILIIFAAVVVLALAAWLAVYIYNHADHATGLQEPEISSYNTAINAAAQKAGAIGEDEFIIIDTISKAIGGNTDITIRVYKLPEGAVAADYADLRVSDLPGDFAPEYMASGTARLLNDSLEKIVVSVTYVK